MRYYIQGNNDAILNDFPFGTMEIRRLWNYLPRILYLGNILQI